MVGLVMRMLPWCLQAGLLMIWRYRHGLTICHRDQRKRQYPDGQQQPAPGMQVLAYPVQGEHFVYSTR
jgi:hypothetical protein